MYTNQGDEEEVAEDPYQVVARENRYWVERSNQQSEEEQYDE